MTRYSSLFLLGLLAAALPSCTKDSQSPAFDDQPVVEGYLVAGQPVHITISRQIAASANVVYATDDINNLQVFLIHNGISYPLQAQGNGVYTDSSLVIAEGERYTLSFAYNQKTVTGTTSIPARPQNYSQSVSSISVEKMDSTTGPPAGGFTRPDPVVLSWTNTDASYYMTVAQNLATNPELIRDTTNRPLVTFRNEPGIEETYSINSFQFAFFGQYRLVLFHLNPDYARLYGNNSNSSQNLTSPETTLQNGLGIFTGMSTDTLFLEVLKK
jgi:hypothetical protein